MAERGERGERGDRGTNGVNGVNGVPCLEDHDLLIRLDEKMDTILKRLTEGDQTIKDHEKRLSKLESFQAVIIGIAGAVSFMVSLVWSKIGAFFGGT
jgi:hypothetical protein